MNISISGRRMTVTDPIRDYATTKVSRVGKIWDSELLNVDVVLSHDRNPSIPKHNHVEITGFMGGFTVRVEEAAPDMYEAVDLAVERFESQIRKFKNRILAKRRGETHERTIPGTTDVVLGSQAASADGALEGGAVEEAPELGSVVRTKSLPAESMSEDEAILRMEMLGHDFYMFQLTETDEPAVVYRRAAGDYGLLRMGDTAAV